VLGGHIVVVQPPPPAWAAAAADEYIPDASDIKEQFWDQSFRQALRQNSRIQKRSLDEVSGTFPGVAELITKRVASRAQVQALQDFVYSFVRNINDRLANKNDISNHARFLTPGGQQTQKCADAVKISAPSLPAVWSR
jgi:hypothetical protein